MSGWEIFIVVILVIIIIALLLILAIGHFAVNYALVPGQGAEKREIDTADEGPHIHQDHYAAERELSRHLTEEWLTTVESDAVSIKTEDGLTLNGHVFRQEGSDKWVIVVHGYQAYEELTFAHARVFHAAGYNVLTYNLRAHGNSEGKYIGFGYLDQDDLLLWTEAIISKHADASIVFHGTSMGGATVLLASAREELPENVKVIIDDCGFSSIRDIFTLELDKRFGIGPRPVLDIANFFAKGKAGYYLSDGEIPKYLGTSRTPTLVVHGTADDFVPVSMSEENFAAIPHAEKKLVYIEGAGHAEAHIVDYEKYYAEVFAFIDKYL